MIPSESGKTRRFDKLPRRCQSTPSVFAELTLTVGKLPLVSEEKQPSTVAEFIYAVRAGLICDRCKRYVGSIGVKTYLPAAYPVALDRIGPADEVSALVGFEWYMLGLMRDGAFTIRHPQGDDGRCVSIREWSRETADDEDDSGELDAETRI